ncbi:MAG: DUF2505 family protein [Polyangiales bacterium]
MRRFTLTHEFNCSVETFWKLNFDREMNEAMFRQGLGFPDYQVQELKDTDTEIFRRTVATPKMDLPGVVQKALGSSFRYTEETRFNKTTKVCHFKGIPSTMADKLTTEGSFRVEALGANRCKRTIEFQVDAKIFAVGGVFEETAEKNMRQSYDVSARFMNKWIADKNLT